MAKDKRKSNSVGAGKKPKNSNDANRPSKGSKGMRDAGTVRRLKMYKTRAVRDKKGKILHEDLQSKELPSTRIQPDRRWFGNTRVIGQRQLEQFREEMSAKVNDAYTVLLREKKLPLQLLQEASDVKAGNKAARASLLATQPFAETFSAGRRRKRPRLATDSLEELLQRAETTGGRFEGGATTSAPDMWDDMKDAAKEAIFDKGQSKRIWGELYKVLDSSDVVVQVLDARDPDGTRCRFLERHIRKNARHKHLILLLNKCDLVPAWVTKRWLHHLSREFPTLAFHASITNPFGKGAMLSLLRQLARLRSDKQAISVGFVGYPNVGKSSVINTLRTKKVCKCAPVPGETKVWQYITLMKRIFLIDCPGVVYHGAADGETAAVLKGVVRVENLDDATLHVAGVLAQVKPEYLRRAYRITSWTSTDDFLAQHATKAGKLLKGGEPDLNTAARMVLYDWQRGRIPFFKLPPGHTEDAPPAGAAAGAGVAAVGAANEAGVPVDGDAAAAEGATAGPFAEGVTEEDAAGEVGARPETAAAAARAMRDAAAAALRAQRRGSIPVKQDYFLEEDAQHGSGEEEELAGASDGSGADELPGSSEELSDESDGGDDGDAGTSGSDSSDGEGGSEEGRSDKEGGPGEREGSGDESDGYGDGGLSWEAVLAAAQGGASLPSSSTPPTPSEQGGATDAGALRKRRRQGRAAGRTQQQQPTPVSTPVAKRKRTKQLDAEKRTLE